MKKALNSLTTAKLDRAMANNTGDFLMKKPKIDTSGTEAAQRAVADAQAAANNLSKNFKADLGTENLTNVVAGGSADAVDADVGAPRKRRAAGAGLSSSLGIT